MFFIAVLHAFIYKSSNKYVEKKFPGEKLGVFYGGLIPFFKKDKFISFVAFGYDSNIETDPKENILVPVKL
ncbi:MAG TPA: hypothetical protein VN698_11980 [Bacteroidia bacterium]|nr:hypothetical protein [Bacteroidia bacterium]